MKPLFFCIGLCLLAACGTSTPDLSPGTPPNTEPPEEVIKPGDPTLEQLFTLVNRARAAGQTCGDKTYAAAPALDWHATLGLSAQKHSEDMAAAGEMSHTTPEGALHYRPGMSPFERMTQEGYAYSAAGENIARGYPTSEAVMEGWLASPGHCRNIMNANFSEVGLGLENGFWTQVFARPR